jgi:hypothetical protein
MATAVSKALLLNIEAFLADNGVRRSVGSFALNYTNPQGTWNQSAFSLNPGETRTINSPSSGVAATVLRVTAPVRVELTLADVANPSAEFSVTKSLVLDAPVQQMVISNEGLTVSQVILFQC